MAAHAVERPSGSRARRYKEPVLRLPPASDEHAVVDRLADRSVAVAALSAFQVDGAVSPAGPALVANYGRPYGHDYRSALDRLVTGLRQVL